ncbi:MAG: hypothetical protein JOZ87_40810 [Chloroflexi bacterium]|nr:hypothetical protein [Chloroflexota bacterium]
MTLLDFPLDARLGRIEKRLTVVERDLAVIKGPARQRTHALAVDRPGAAAVKGGDPRFRGAVLLPAELQPDKPKVPKD